MGSAGWNAWPCVLAVGKPVSYWGLLLVLLVKHGPYCKLKSSASFIYIYQFCDYRVATLNFEILRLMLGSGEKPQVPALGA